MDLNVYRAVIRDNPKDVLLVIDLGEQLWATRQAAHARARELAAVAVGETDEERELATVAERFDAAANELEDARRALKEREAEVRDALAQADTDDVIRAEKAQADAAARVGAVERRVAVLQKLVPAHEGKAAAARTAAEKAAQAACLEANRARLDEARAAVAKVLAGIPQAALVELAALSMLVPLSDAERGEMIHLHGPERRSA